MFGFVSVEKAGVPKREFPLSLLHKYKVQKETKMPNHKVTRIYVVYTIPHLATKTARGSDSSSRIELESQKPDSRDSEITNPSLRGTRVPMRR